VNSLTQTDIEELRKLEEELWLSDTRFNEDYMRQVMSSDFIEFGRSGKIYNLEDVLSIGTQPIKAVLPLPDLNIRQLSSDVVQITYNSAVGREHETEYSRRSSIWTRSEGKWKLRFHQGTPYASGT